MTNDEIKLKMLGDASQLQKTLDDTNDKAKDLRKTIKQIEQDGGKGSENWKKYKQELKETEEQAKKLSAELKQMNIADMTFRQLELHIKNMNKELKNMVPGSKEAATQLAKIGEAEGHLKKVQVQAGKIKDEATNLAKPGMWSDIKKYMTAAFAINGIESLVMGVVNFGKEAVKKAAEASDAFGGISKTTGMTTEEIHKLDAAVRKIDTRTAQEDLLAIAKVGGQIGISKDEMLGFVESVDKATVALGDEFTGGAEEVASKMGVLSKLFKETKDLDAGTAINQIGSAVNALGAAGSATAPVIADFATRMGALGDLSPQISETLGLGAAFQELGLTAEISAGGLTNIMLGASKATGLFAEHLGMTEGAFKKLINTNPNGVILELAKSFKGLPVDVVAKQMDDLGIKSQEASKVMLLLANKTDFVTEKQKLSAVEMKKATSLGEEFNVMNNTAGANLAKVGKEVDSLKVLLGTYLLPVVLGVTSGMVALIKVLIAIPEFVRENKEAFSALGVAILALNAANIKAQASTLAHLAAEKASAIASKVSAAAKAVHTIAMEALVAQNQKATTTSYLHIAAEKIRTTVLSTLTGAKNALRAVMAALTLENIKATVAATAHSAVEKGRAAITATVTAAQTALRAITTALTLENIKATASAVLHSAVEKGRAAVTYTVAAATTVLNTVMKANPIGLVVGLVGGLIIAFKAWYDRSETLRAGMAGLWAAVKTVGTVIADVWSALTSLDFGKVTSILSEGGKQIAASFSKGYQDQLKSEAPKLVAQHKAVVDAKAEASKKAAQQAADAEVTAGADATEQITKKEQEALEKRQKARERAQEKVRKDREKALEVIAQMEGEHEQHVAANSLETEEAKIQEKRRKRLKEINDLLVDEAIKEKARAGINKNADAEIIAVRKKANEKALEMLAQMEAEYEQDVTQNSLEAEEKKILEKKRKRIKEIQDSEADEKMKGRLIEAANKSSEAELEKVRSDYRTKRQKADDEAAKKRLDAELFIKEQERRAEMAIFDFRELEARNNSGKLLAIRKERADAELRLTQEKLAAELAAEQQKAIADITDLEQLAAALNAIESRYDRESVLAVAKTAQEKADIDKEYKRQRVENLQLVSSTFKSLLDGDTLSFFEGMGKILGKAKEVWADLKKNDAEGWAARGEMALMAVDFLNALAQKKAQKHIEIAARERDEKIGILQNELTVAESMVTSSSNYVQALKSAEKDRLAELQRILTSETATEEDKRDALRNYYSEQFKQMKAAEEQKIKDLQHEANMAKTEDEKQAIEAKIKLAKEESETKVKLAEEELESKKKTIDELTTFTTETTEAVLAEATDASETQVKLAEDEAQVKYDTKVDLEEAIAEENRKFREKESAEKKKAWEAQKKADIATALITGALAILKALANFFPLNIVLAATAGVVTAVQINKIKNQVPPAFEQGGFVARGGRHGSSYGQGGIQLIDRASGREVGEMEGDEAIVSREQTEANWPIIERMFSNARTPGMRDKPVSGKPMAFRDGGRFESPYFEKSMYLFGIKKKKKEAEEMARQAEADAAKAQAEADAMMGSYGFDDAGAYGGIDQGGVGINGDTAAAQAAHEKAQKQGEMQLELLEVISENTKESADNVMGLSRLIFSKLDELKGSVGETTQAVRSVEGAVNAANTQGRFSELIGAISSLGGPAGG